MSFHKYGSVVSFPRNEHVDIHVRPVTLNADAPEGARVEAIEIREFIKDGEVYGNGIVFPARAADDLIVALRRVKPVKGSVQ